MSCARKGPCCAYGTASAHVQVYGLLERGAMQRATGTTKMNELSSRSHAVFIIIIEKSTVTSMQEADGDEMEQFRGIAPGSIPLSNPNITSPVHL